MCQTADILLTTIPPSVAWLEQVCTAGFQVTIGWSPQSCHLVQYEEETNHHKEYLWRDRLKLKQAIHWIQTLGKKRINSVTHHWPLTCKIHKPSHSCKVVFYHQYLNPDVKNNKFTSLHIFSMMQPLLKESSSPKVAGSLPPKLGYQNTNKHWENKHNLNVSFSYILGMPKNCLPYLKHPFDKGLHIRGYAGSISSQEIIQTVHTFHLATLLY